MQIKLNEACANFTWLSKVLISNQNTLLKEDLKIIRSQLSWADGGFKMGVQKGLSRHMFIRIDRYRYGRWMI